MKDISNTCVYIYKYKKKISEFQPEVPFPRPSDPAQRVRRSRFLHRHAQRVHPQGVLPGLAEASQASKRARSSSGACTNALTSAGSLSRLFASSVAHFYPDGLPMPPPSQGRVRYIFWVASIWRAPIGSLTLPKKRMRSQKKVFLLYGSRLQCLHRVDVQRRTVDRRALEVPQQLVLRHMLQQQLHRGSDLLPVSDLFLGGV